MKELRYFGPPGTGKSSLLATEKIPAAVKKYGSDRVIVTSFTRAAAKEIASKRSRETGERIPVDRNNIGTLHSLCYRALGQPELVQSHIIEWNNKFPRWAINGTKINSLDEGGVEIFQGAKGDRYLSNIDIKRAKMIPQKFWSRETIMFHTEWEKFKSKNGYVDFTDLIEKCLKTMPYAPGNPKVMFIDEAQDFVPLQLELIRAWGINMDWHVLVGDDDQASLKGTKVLTKNGNVYVEDLVPGKDKIISYDFKHSHLFTRKGFDFQIQPSFYNDQAIYVNNATGTTHNHPWIIRWNDKAYEKSIVYLMRKGHSFRVGWCKLMRADGCWHFARRCAIEKADAGWILRVCDSKSEASLWESYVSAQYGISTALWRPMHDQERGHYTKAVIKELFDKLGNQTLRGLNCLRDFQKYMKFPIYKKETLSKYGRKNYKVIACNLFPEVMSIPIPNKNKVSWEPIKSVERKQYKGRVYGLDIKPHHNYIADGIITHNCIYRFTGASPDAFINPPIDDKFKIILNQSWRVPKAVFDRSQILVAQLSMREPKKYYPRNAHGSVNFHASNFSDTFQLVQEIKEYVKTGKTAMILTSCSYMLDDIKNNLTNDAIPFHNPYRTKRGDWNPLSAGSKITTARDLVVNFSETGPDDNFWTIDQLVSWVSHLRVGDSSLLRKKGNIMIKAMKQAIEDKKDGLHSSRHTLSEILSPDAIKPALERNVDWLYENLKPIRKKAILYPIQVHKKYGLDAVKEKPKIIIGTIHSVKGGEADRVYLFPDISIAAAREKTLSIENVDSLVRLFYVGMTRAKEDLVIMTAKTPRLSVTI